MLQIGQLLERFKNISNSEKTKKILISEIFENNNIPIKIDQISIIRNTVYLKTNPIIKTEALLKGEEVLKKIKELPGLRNITNIQ